MPDWPSGADRFIDALGFRCPVPVIKLEAALRRAAAGERIAIRTDDPIAAVDVPHAARTGGHPCERIAAADDICVFLVTKSSGEETE